VIPDEVVAGPVHRGPGIEQALLEFSQPSCAAAIGMRNQRMDLDAPADRGVKSPLEVIEIEPEITSSMLFRAFLIAATSGAIASRG
jgi:hypothetical protein